MVASFAGDAGFSETKRHMDFPKVERLMNKGALIPLTWRLGSEFVGEHN